MGCSIWAVDTIAFINDKESSIARFHLGASVAISDNISFPPVVIMILEASERMFTELAPYRFAHVLYASEKPYGDEKGSFKRCP